MFRYGWSQALFGGEPLDASLTRLARLGCRGPLVMECDVFAPDRYGRLAMARLTTHDTTSHQFWNNKGDPE
ncbi:MAG: hypothetical protein ACK5JR_08810 [Tropicimonas sp.]|uniref:hypothetical protein n=1 Tax=Tropicimonas sp. TaxID=2067044 RepID=UPI003A87CCC1